MRDQRIDECSVRISGRRVHDQASRFFDDDEILIFIDDLQGYVLALRNGRRRRGNADRVDFTGFDPEIAVSYRFASVRNGSVLDQLLKARTADVAECGDKKAVEPPTRLVVLNDGSARSLRGGFCVKHAGAGGSSKHARIPWGEICGHRPIRAYHPGAHWASRWRRDEAFRSPAAFFRRRFRPDLFPAARRQDLDDRRPTWPLGAAPALAPR